MAASSELITGQYRSDQLERNNLIHQFRKQMTLETENLKLLDRLKAKKPAYLQGTPFESSLKSQLILNSKRSASAGRQRERSHTSQSRTRSGHITEGEAHLKDHEVDLNKLKEWRIMSSNTKPATDDNTSKNFFFKKYKK